MRPEAGAGADEIIGTYIERRAENIVSLFTNFKNIALPAVSLECLFDTKSYLFRISGVRRIRDQTSLNHFNLVFPLSHG
jgi:hypothetical protein